MLDYQTNLNATVFKLSNLLSENKDKNNYVWGWRFPIILKLSKFWVTTFFAVAVFSSSMFDYCLTQSETN